MIKTQEEYEHTLEQIRRFQTEIFLKSNTVLKQPNVHNIMEEAYIRGLKSMVTTLINQVNAWESKEIK